MTFIAITPGGRRFCNDDFYSESFINYLSTILGTFSSRQLAERDAGIVIQTTGTIIDDLRQPEPVPVERHLEPSALFHNSTALC
jgi:hypothetical protein